MEEIVLKLPQRAREKQKENKKFFSKLRKKTPKNLDYQMQELHREEFQRTECLQCANCCKTTGPLFTQTDVVRIAKHLRSKPQKFVETYLRTDEDNDLVLQQLPCPFLGADNHCGIYGVRPKACREFPHTDRKKFQQIGHLTQKNVAICPAAFNIVENLKAQLAAKGW
ncbi:YkgJ family cysteine cluster protein [Maribacter sp. 2307ULW6-5]|uniref:YkgJ family cysteine cluster protein n=1 Tax=Maribacter sp. 2307ULW6-5 TaxID=3386275 RepID=UPI0039BCA19E